MTDSRDKSYVLNVMDTPGHPCFSDEVTASMRISDGVILVVDCIEGMTTYVERLVKEALRQ
jgi:U5 small nuclear ribonucleoprotein component